MKKLSKLKLNQFSKVELEQRALKALKGGCAYGTNPYKCRGTSTGETVFGICH